MLVSILSLFALLYVTPCCIHAAINSLHNTAMIACISVYEARVVGEGVSVL
jgi:hypothetical protein